MVKFTNLKSITLLYCEKKVNSSRLVLTPPYLKVKIAIIAAVMYYFNYI